MNKRSSNSELAIENVLEDYEILFRKYNSKYGTYNIWDREGIDNKLPQKIAVLYEHGYIKYGDNLLLYIFKGGRDVIDYCKEAYEAKKHNTNDIIFEDFDDFYTSFLLKSFSFLTKNNKEDNISNYNVDGCGKSLSEVCVPFRETKIRRLKKTESPGYIKTIANSYFNDEIKARNKDEYIINNTDIIESTPDIETGIKEDNKEVQKTEMSENEIFKEVINASYEDEYLSYLNILFRTLKREELSDIESEYYEYIVSNYKGLRGVGGVRIPDFFLIITYLEITYFAFKSPVISGNYNKYYYNFINFIFKEIIDSNSDINRAVLRNARQVILRNIRVMCDKIENKIMYFWFRFQEENRRYYEFLNNYMCKKNGSTNE